MPPKPPSPRLTHFLCIPLVTPPSRTQLLASLSKFRDDVTRDGTAENLGAIPERAIRPAGTLHLTLGVMSLLSPEKVDRATALLRSLDLKEMLDMSTGKGERQASKHGSELALKPRGLRVTLRGLQSMHTASQTSILYSAPVDEDQRLQSFCQKLKDAFMKAELLVSESRPLLLHATILNTVYVPRVRVRGVGHRKRRAKLTIDATGILEKYDDFEWMSNVRIENVAICRMGAAKLDDGNEEYVVEAKVEMPFGEETNIG